MQFKPSSSPPVRTQIRSVCNQPSNTLISVSSTRQFVFLPQERITFSPSLTSWRQEYLTVIRCLCLNRRKTISRRTKRGRRATTSLIELSTNSPQYIATIANFILAVLFKINRTSEVFNLEMQSSCTNWHLISHVLTNGGSGRSRITQTGGGGAYPWVWAKNLLFENIFCRKLHENERNWTEMGARIPGANNEGIIAILSSLYVYENAN